MTHLIEGNKVSKHSFYLDGPLKESWREFRQFLKQQVQDWVEFRKYAYELAMIMSCLMCDENLHLLNTVARWGATFLC